MSEEFEVEIDGALFLVRRVASAVDGGEAEGEIAKLIARACLMAEGNKEKGKIQSAFKEALETAPKKTAAFFNDSLEKPQNEKTAFFQDAPNEFIAESGYKEALPRSEKFNYRRQAESLSRFLKRDSRRYDGYFEMF